MGFSGSACLEMSQSGRPSRPQLLDARPTRGFTPSYQRVTLTGRPDRTFNKCDLPVGLRWVDGTLFPGTGEASAARLRPTVPVGPTWSRVMLHRLARGVAPANTFTALH